MRLQHRTASRARGERSLCCEQIWAGRWRALLKQNVWIKGWINVDQSRTDPLYVFGQNPRGGFFFFGFVCLRTFSLYADYEIRCIETLTQSTASHLHIYTSFGPQLRYVLTVMISQLAPCVPAPC